MLTSVSPETSRKQNIWKSASHDSIFQSSPTSSFAEEVADALCSRAKALGNSHPSVVFGKQKRLMEGLMGVAETIRRDFPKTNEDLAISTPTRSNILLSEKHARDNNETGENHHDRISSSMEEVVNEDSFLKPSVSIKDLDIQPSERNKDYSDGNFLGEPECDVRLPEDMSFSRISHQQRKPAKPKRSRFRKAKRDESPSNSFQPKVKKKRRSLKKSRFRGRILAFVNNNSLRNFRKSFLLAWSRTKTVTENNFTRLKRHVFKSNKK